MGDKVNELRVTCYGSECCGIAGYGLRVAGVRVTGYGLRVTGGGQRGHRAWGIEGEDRRQIADDRVL